MTIQEKFGIAVKRIRKKHKMSQEKFALEAGIDRKYMSEIENGKTNVSLKIIERICDTLELNLEDFFREVELAIEPERTLADYKGYFVEEGYGESIMLDDFVDALIGIDENGRAVYSYSKMVTEAIQKKEMDFSEAVDFISYGIVRGLPYLKEKAPIIVYDIRF